MMVAFVLLSILLVFFLFKNLYVIPKIIWGEKSKPYVTGVVIVLVVIGEKADGTRYLQMDDNYLGTYNFGTYSFVPIEFSHIPLDVFPYYSMKNTPCRFIRNLRN